MTDRFARFPPLAMAGGSLASMPASAPNISER